MSSNYLALLTYFCLKQTRQKLQVTKCNYGFQSKVRHTKITDRIWFSISVKQKPIRCSPMWYIRIIRMWKHAHWLIQPRIEIKIEIKKNKVKKKKRNEKKKKQYEDETNRMFREFPDVNLSSRFKASIENCFASNSYWYR